MRVVNRMKPGHQSVARGFGLCRGQAMIESCIVIVFLCLLFMGLFQLAHAYVSREVLYYAAARAARAKTVGLNQWMVEKTMRVAAIPNAGRLVEPVVPGQDAALANALATLSPGQIWDFALKASPRSPTIDTELARVPEYLASDNEARAHHILDYDLWDTIGENGYPEISVGAGAIIDPSAGSLITARVKQPHELLVALGALTADDLNGLQQAPGNVLLIGSYQIEDHYSLYLDDSNW